MALFAMWSNTLNKRSMWKESLKLILLCTQCWKFWMKFGHCLESPSKYIKLIAGKSLVLNSLCNNNDVRSTLFISWIIDSSPSIRLSINASIGSLPEISVSFGLLVGEVFTGLWKGVEFLCLHFSFFDFKGVELNVMLLWFLLKCLPGFGGAK